MIANAPDTFWDKSGAEVRTTSMGNWQASFTLARKRFATIEKVSGITTFRFASQLVGHLDPENVESFRQHQDVAPFEVVEDRHGDLFGCSAGRHSNGESCRQSRSTLKRSVHLRNWARLECR